jgi:alpha-methylacyl-CoA racemase
MAVGAIEVEFRLQLLRLLGLQDEAASIMAADDADPEVRRRLADIFKTRTRAAWQALFDDTDACVSPVLSLDEVTTHPQTAATQTFSTIDGVVHPNPAPRFSRTVPARPERDSADAADAKLADWGLARTDVR